MITSGYVDDVECDVVGVSEVRASMVAPADRLAAGVMPTLPLTVLEQAEEEEEVKKVGMVVMMLGLASVVCGEDTVLQKTLKRMDSATDLQRALGNIRTPTDWEWVIRDFRAILNMGHRNRIVLHWTDNKDGRLFARPNMPHGHAVPLAGTAQREWDGTCHIVITKEMSQEGLKKTLAHEVCHCELDYDFIGDDYNNSKFDYARAEVRAEKCAAWLTDDQNRSQWVHAMKTGWKPDSLVEWRRKK